MIYEIVKEYDVVPNIRRAGIEAHEGWVILELTGPTERATPRSPTSRGSGARSTAWKATCSRVEVSDDELTPKPPRRAGWRCCRRPAPPSSPGSRARCRGGCASVERLLDAWGAPTATDAAALEAASAAGPSAARRVGDRLAALLAVDPAEQRATPLEIVRTVYVEPTEILVAAGVPPVVRDPFDERAWPEDRYDLVPRTLGDLGDPDLGPLHPGLGHGQGDRAAGSRAERAT